MKLFPNLIFLTRDWIESLPYLIQYSPEKGWGPDRPLGHPSLLNRFKLAWMVFTGRADAIVWPKSHGK